jgi:hypothetical protein
VNGTTASRHDDSHAEALSSLDCQAGVWVLGTGAPAGKEDVGELQAGRARGRASGCCIPAASGARVR